MMITEESYDPSHLFQIPMIGSIDKDANIKEKVIKMEKLRFDMKEEFLDFEKKM